MKLNRACSALRRGFVLGSCLLMFPMLAHAGEITLNFKDADIQSVIRFMSDLTGKNFLIDSRVKGKVSIVSPRAISEDDAYGVFLSVLEMNGFAAVPSGSVVKIIPAIEAKQKGVPVHAGESLNDSDSLVTQVVKVDYADAGKLVAILRPVLSPQSYMVAHTSGNLIVITDRAQSVRYMMELIAVLDQGDMKDVAMIPLQYASAERLATMLQDVYQVSDKQGSFRIMSSPFGNMLIVSGSESAVVEVRSMVEKLDTKPEKDSGRLSVRYLQHADAEAVAKVLGELVSQSKTEKGQAIFTGDVRVVADAPTNALLITADMADREELNRIIDKLDIRRLQVLVEALIVEVTGNVGQQFGVEWQAASNNLGNGQNLQAIGGTNFPNNAQVGINAVAQNPFAAGSGLMLGAVKGTINFNGQQFLNLGALLRALESNTDTNILSTPNLLTMDNEEAEIVIGQNVPFITGQSSTQGGVTNPFQTIERKDVGLSLKVKPQISEGDSVRLEIYQEVSSLQGGDAAQGGYITAKRSIKTTVLASNKDIIVLGGLIRDDSTVSVQKVPCLGSIPLLGEAFKFTQNTKTKTNLMVFLRPHIIKDKNDIKTITQEKYMDIRSLYENPAERGTLVFPREEQELPQQMSPLQETPTQPAVAAP